MGSLVLYCVLVLLTAWAGAAAPFLFHRRKDGHPFLHFFISFGAGIMLGAAFLHLLPDAFRLAGEDAGFAALAGFLLLFLLESFSFSHPCEDEQHDYHALGWVAVLGLSLHNLVNGVALGAGARVPVVGWVVFAATVAHKAPEFFSLSSILLAGRRPVWRTAALVLTVSAMIPLGAFASNLFLSQSGERVLGLALGFSSGTFIHLAVVDLAPEMRQHRDRLAHFASFLLGVALMALAAWLE
ncbi:MAG TPA: ZIP family metal transporter [bacterium]|nr:ZIP family metal transporter [bacterium]